MKKTVTVIASIFIFTVLMVSCSDSPTNFKSDSVVLRQLNAIEKQIIESNRDFSYNLFSSVVDTEQKQNVFISPLSLSYALGMTMNGADGETLEQIKNTLGFNGVNINNINQGYQSLIELLTGIDPSVETNIANSIWSREGFELNTTFINNLETFFDARFSELDFSDPAAADIINQWVEEQTNGRIKNIVNAPISSSTVMFLINALYFQGDWAQPFDPENTQPKPFHLENGESVEVDMMKQTSMFATYRSDEVTMIEMPYGDSLFAMSVIIPPDNMPIDEFVEQKMNATTIEEWRSQVKQTKVDLQIPKFELSYEIGLNDVLKSIGITNAFGENADFSSITGSPNDLYVSKVKQKTFVKIDEKGTEATAATSVVIADSLPPSVIVDKPFVVIISEKTSGANLFMGKIKNPNLTSE